MRKFILILLCLLLSQAAWSGGDCQSSAWQSMFDGKTLDGWRASENKGSFTVKDGEIVAHGERSHLFYVGKIQDAKFTDFEFKADIMTSPGGNSGIYIHTAYQETDWPKTGYESQVNNTHSDSQKTGGLYGVDGAMVKTAPAKDNTWFTQHIIVRGKHVVVKIDGNTVVDYTEPDNVHFADWPGRKLSCGTFALQGHDPGSLVRYKNIMVKPLTRQTEWVNLFDGETLNGWRQINGSAKYEVKDGAIVGTTAMGSPNSFLCTEKLYGDFELKFEVKVDSRLNSGVQIRSNSFEEYQNGRVHGYQVEIATNGTAGFIYDEGRRGWLSKDRSDEKARNAFKKEQWNKYRVLCVGDSIKTWVNCVLVANLVDSMTKNGFIGLQVHSFVGIGAANVQWRNLRIKEIECKKPSPKSCSEAKKSKCSSLCGAASK